MASIAAIRTSSFLSLRALPDNAQGLGDPVLFHAVYDIDPDRLVFVPHEPGQKRVEPLVVEVIHRLDEIDPVHGSFACDHLQDHRVKTVVPDLFQTAGRRLPEGLVRIDEVVRKGKDEPFVRVFGHLVDNPDFLRGAVRAVKAVKPVLGHLVCRHGAQLFKILLLFPFIRLVHDAVDKAGHAPGGAVFFGAEYGRHEQRVRQQRRGREHHGGPGQECLFSGFHHGR